MNSNEKRRLHKREENLAETDKLIKTKLHTHVDEIRII